jgi:hypothetical protein
MGDSISPWVAGGLEDVQARARQWIESPALEALVETLGGPPSGGIDRLLAWTSETLDTRAGAERRDAASVKWEERAVDALVSAAGPLGLLATAKPSLSAYGGALILGGATTGNELRTAFVRDLVEGSLRIGEIYGLAAHRPLSVFEGDEALARAGIDTEWTHLRRCLAEAFGPMQAEGSMAGGMGWQQWSDDRYRGKGGLALRLLVAPSSSSSRPNTSDAIAFFLERHPDEVPKHLLVVTSAIYVPYQFFAVAGSLVSGGVSHVEFVGTPTSTSGDRGVLAQRIAQEIHGAVASVARLSGP